MAKQTSRSVLAAMKKGAIARSDRTKEEWRYNKTLSKIEFYYEDGGWTIADQFGDMPWESDYRGYGPFTLDWSTAFFDSIQKALVN